MLANADDEIKVSTLNVNLEEASITFDGQANAGASTDGIDYRVVEEFRKKVEAMHYDYGRYVDDNGDEIPAYCIEDTDAVGEPYRDVDGNYFAYWLRGSKGCDPSRDDFEEGEQDEDSDDGEENQNIVRTGGMTTAAATEVIYRTPKFEEWYSDDYIDTDGSIFGIAHFESQCANYSGTTNSNGNVVWQTTYDDSCMLAPDGVYISNSSDGRGAGGTLVARFSATISFEPEVFNFNNKHVLAIAPKGRTNVTDSFIQIGEMFTEKATDLGN